jgi:hypothetical protein
LGDEGGWKGRGGVLSVAKGLPEGAVMQVALAAVHVELELLYEPSDLPSNNRSINVIEGGTYFYPASTSARQAGWDHQDLDVPAKDMASIH